MSSRRRVALTTKQSREQGWGRVTSVGQLALLLGELERYGPEPEGIVVEVDEAALSELPDRWRWEPVGNGGAAATLPNP